MDAQQFFSTMGVNFMTPKIHSYVNTEKYFIEISTGNFLNNPIVGVTVYLRKTGKITEFCKKVDSLKQAFKIVNQLSK